MRTRPVSPVGLLETHMLCCLAIRTHSAYNFVCILRLDQDEAAEALLYLAGSWKTASLA